MVLFRDKESGINMAVAIKLYIMTELIIIKTEDSERVRNLLNKEQINYEVFYEKEDKLLQEYQEAWQNPQRLVEAQQWEQAAINDWVERIGKEKK